MKKANCLFYVLCILMILISAQLSAGMVVNSVSERNLEISATIPEIEFVEVNYIDGKTYSKLIVGQSGQMPVGMPDVPLFANWILIPNGTEVHITAREGESTIYENIDLPPVQPSPSDSKDEPLPPFTIDESVFSIDADYPGIFAETDPIKNKRGQSCTILRIYPYQYNPVQKTLTIYNDLKISVNFTGSVKPIPSNLRNANAELYLKSTAINGDAVLQAENEVEILQNEEHFRTDGCELLIITDPDYQDAANTLAAWKIRKGIYTMVANTTTTGTSRNDIEDYIDDAYDTWTPAPSYLLFIGDAEDIPVCYDSMHPNGDGHIGTDFFYADYDDPADYVADFGYGRLSVDSSDEADSLVARIIRYERSPTTNSDYYDDILNAACFQDGEYWGCWGPIPNCSWEAPDSVANRRFCKTSEDVRNYLIMQGFSSQREYVAYNRVTGFYTPPPTYEIFPTYWNSTTQIGTYIFENDNPPDGGDEIPAFLQKPAFAWDGNTVDITDAFEDGVHFALFRAHGSRSGWGDPDFGSWNVDALNNGENRPFIWSITCRTGWFDNETDDAAYGTAPASECFAEHWLRHNTGGSCGILAATRNSSSGKNDRLIWGMMDAMWPGFLTWTNDPYGGTDPIFRMGDVINYGKQYMETKYGSDAEPTIELFHWFGDPTCEMWTSEPNELTSAEVTSDIEIGTFSITVEVTPAVEDMLVSICTENADNIFGTAETNASGIATVTLNHAITIEDEIFVTITKHDYLPYEFVTGWATNTWLGTHNYLWNTGANWSLGHAPTDQEDVVITSDGFHPPNISSSTAYCNNLSFESGAELTQTGSYFRVYGDFNSDSGTFTQSASGYLYFDGYSDTSWDDDNEDDTYYNVRVDKDDPAYGVYLWQDMTVQNNFEIREGELGIHQEWTLNITGTGNSALQIEDGGKLSLDDETVIVAGGIEFEDGSQLETGDGSSIHCGGNFKVEANTAYDIEFGWGSWLNMDGSGDQYIQDLDGGNLRLHGIYLDNSGCCYIANEDLVIEGTINLYGALSCKSSPSSSTVHDIYIAGGWFVHPGGSFEESTGRVIFNGSFDSRCWGEDFNIIEIAKGADAVFEVTDGGSVYSNSYDWTSGGIEIEDGTFTAADLLDDGLFGSYTVHTDGVINLHQDGSSFIDLHGDITIECGTMNVYGGSIKSYWPYLDDASITMTDGVLDFKDNGIFVCVSGSHTLTENISGGTIRTSGGFIGDRADFHPEGGTIELYGSSDVSLSHGVGSSFYNVDINKSATRTKEKEVIKVDRNGNRISRDRANTAYAFSDLDLQGDLLISDGTFGLNGYTVDVSQNVDIYGTLQMFNFADELNIGDDIYWRSGSNSNLTHGQIDLDNDWYFYDGTNAQLGSNNTVSLIGSETQFIYCLDEDAEFNDLIIDKTSRAAWIHSSSTDTMRVAGDMTVTAGDIFQIETSDLLIEGILEIEDTGALYLEHDGGTMTNNSDLTLNGELNIDGGNALIHGEFELAETGNLTIDSGSFISNAPYSGIWQFLNGAFNQSDGLFEITYNSINIGTLFEENITGGIFRFGASFNAATENDFQPNGGVAEATAVQTGRNISCSNGNYFHDLQINGANTISISSDLIIQNDLDIDSGSLDSNSQTISLGGDWTNNVGDVGFMEEESTVIFNGADESDITTDETFYNMILDKTNGQYYALELMDGITVNVLNDMNILDATLEMNNGSTLDIDNDLDIALDAGLNAFGEPGLNIYIGGDWSDDNDHHDSWNGFYYGTSTVTFDGDDNQSLITASAVDSLYNVIIDKPSGYFRPSNDTRIFGALTISDGQWYDSVNYLVHYLYGDFTVSAGAGWNGTTMNAVVFSGTVDQDVSFDPPTTDGYLFDVYVNKTAESMRTSTPTGEELIRKKDQKDRDDLRSNTVFLDTDCISLGNGNLTVNDGTLDLNGHYYRCTGNVSINSGGIIALDDNSSLEIGNGYDLNVNDGGTFQIIGSAGNEATLTHHSGYYDVDIESGGTIRAEHAIFEFMTAPGVEIKSGAIVDNGFQFTNCTFREGIAGGTLLTINNAMTLTIDSAVFPENTWGSSYNVRKLVDEGNVTFTNATGDFAGPLFENDTYVRIHWDGFAPDLEVTNVVWSSFESYSCDQVVATVTVYNNGNLPLPVDYPFYIDIFYNPTNPPVFGEYGDQFVQIDSGLPVGDFIEHEFYITHDLTETWNSYVLLDTDEIVDELDEDNNLWGPDVVNWNALPAIDDLTIQIVDDEVFLSWTYPINVDYFNIYISDDPHDFSEAVVEISGVNSYSEEVTGTMRYYYVTAFRDCTPSVVMKDTNRDVAKVNSDER